MQKQQGNLSEVYKVVAGRYNLIDALRPDGVRAMLRAYADDQRKLTEVGLEDARHFMPGFVPKDAWQDAWRYILPSLASKLFGLRSSWEDVMEVLNLMQLCLAITKADNKEVLRGLNASWPEMQKKLRRNRGMTKLMLDHGYLSQIIYPYILAGAGAISLEVFFGRAFNLAGEFVEFPVNELASYYAVWEPIGVFIRQRVAYAQQWLEQLGYGSRILSCGAGFCPEFRLNDYEWTMKYLQQRVVAVDEDEEVIKNLELVYGRDPSELGITYLKDRVENVCADLAHYRRYDAVLMQGLLSYYHDVGSNRRTVELLRGLTKTLRPGGIIICDLQVFEPTLVRCALSMGWESDLLPDWTAESAIRRMEKACRKVGLEVVSVKIDAWNKTPCGVMFTLRWKP